MPTPSSARQPWTQRGPSTFIERPVMFPFPSPLEFLRAFALAFATGAAFGMASIALLLSALASFRQSICFRWKR
jgi:hypothetical protein